MVQVGREQDHQHVDNYVYIQNPKVSRQHLKIEVGECQVHDVDQRTPLLVHFESRKPTEVNGLFYKPSKNEEPLVKDFTDQDMKIKFKGTESRIELTWAAFNVTPHSGKIVYENEVTTSPLPKKLQLLFDRGIDLRITNDIKKATHYVTHSDHANWPFRIALLAGIPILNSFWVDYVFDNKHRVEEWFVNIADERFLPSSQDDKSYLFPNPTRKALLRSQHIILLANRDSAKLETWIQTMGANTTLFDPGKYFINESVDETRLFDDIRSLFQELSITSAFLMRTTTKNVNDGLMAKSLAEICIKHNGSLLDEILLLESVKSVSTKNLHAISSIRKRPEIEASTSPTEPKPLQKRRRKFEKIGANDLLDFQLASLQGTLYPSATQNLEREKKIIEESVSRTITPSVDPNFPDSPLGFPKEAFQDDKPKQIEVISDEEREKEHKKGTSLQERQNDISEATKSEEPKSKKVKTESKIPKFIPSVSLVDAIKSTKQQATESIKKELGIDDDSLTPIAESLGAKLGDLAIVETVEIELRKAPSTPHTSDRYKGRKNFKAFKKNLAIKSNMTRSFIDLEAVKIDNEVQFITSYDGQSHAEVAKSEQKLSKDFQGIMDDVKGYVPPLSTSPNEEDGPDQESFSFRSGEQSLFVADDDSQPTLRSVNLNHKEVANEEDSDEDDDEPKFTFRRS